MLLLRSLCAVGLCIFLDYDNTTFPATTMLENITSITLYYWMERKTHQQHVYR